MIGKGIVTDISIKWVRKLIILGEAVTRVFKGKEDAIFDLKMRQKGSPFLKNTL